MVYTLIGKAVVKGLKLYLRSRYGAARAPKPVVAGAVVVGVVGAALLAAKREAS
jgi:hypothetical protein